MNKLQNVIFLDGENVGNSGCSNEFLNTREVIFEAKMRKIDLNLNNEDNAIPSTSKQVFTDFEAEDDTFTGKGTLCTSEEELQDQTLSSESGDADLWFSCSGKLAFLSDLFDSIKKLISDIQNEPVLNNYMAAIKMIDISETIKDTCIDLTHSCKNYIATQKTENKNFSTEDRSEANLLIMHDPGLRTKVKSDQQREYLIELGPHQPILSKFPSDGKNRFNAQWYKQFNFLEYSTVKDLALCFVCSLFPEGVRREKSENNWSTEGVRTWGKMKSSGSKKKGKLALHFKSSTHKSALRDYFNFMNKNQHVDILMDQTKRRLLLEEQRIFSHNKAILEILFDTAKTLARQGLAFRGSENEIDNFSQIVHLISRHNSILKRWLDDTQLRPYHVTYLSPQSQNEIIELLGNAVRSKVVQEIDEAPLYTIMADHTPDSSNKDILSLVVRTVDRDGIPKERLLCVIETLDKTGSGTACDILNCLQSQNINLDKLAFQSYDFTAAMSGKFNGTQNKISEILHRNIPYVPCQAHRLNTAVEHCCKASPIVKDTFNILEELYVFFTSSTKRFQPLRNKLEKIENAILLKNLSKTRWTARVESLQAVSTSFEGIVEVLEEIFNSGAVDNNTQAKAYGLFKRILNFDFVCCLMFLKTVLYKMKIVTKILESPHLNIIDAISIIQGSKDSIAAMRKSEHEIDNLVESAKTFAKKLEILPEEDYKKHHRRRLGPNRFDDFNDTASDFSIKQYYRKEFLNVLDVLVSFLENNLNEVLMIINPLVKLFSMPLSKQNISINTIEMLTPLNPCDKPDEFALQVELDVYLIFA